MYGMHPMTSAAEGFAQRGGLEERRPDAVDGDRLRQFIRRQAGESLRLRMEMTAAAAVAELV